MTKPLSGQSIACRRAQQERAQAAALDDLDAKAEARREQSRKLRKLRLEQNAKSASQFKRWRDGDSSQDA